MSQNIIKIKANILMADRVFEIISTLITFIMGMFVWIYNRQVKLNDRNVDELKLKVDDVDRTNREIKDNYIKRFESLHDDQHKSEIAILEGLSKLSYDLLEKIEDNNKELKSELSEGISTKIESAINVCKLRELKSRG